MSAENPDHYLVTKRRRGLTPTAHLPSADNPDGPRCGQGLTDGGGWRREDPGRIEPEQICRTCTSDDSLAKGADHSLYLKTLEKGREGSA